MQSFLGIQLFYFGIYIKKNTSYFIYFLRLNGFLYLSSFVKICFYELTKIFFKNFRSTLIFLKRNFHYTLYAIFIH